MTSPTKRRLIGVDVARGVALLGMFAVHIFTALNDDGSPTAVTMVASGRSATLFAFLAGVSLAFISGRRKPAAGRDLTLVRAGLVGRAVVVATIGYLVTYINEVGEVYVAIILVFYALAFVVALPFLGLRTKPLLAIAGVLAVVGPVIRYALDQFLRGGVDGGVPTAAALTDPIGILITLTVEGTYPLTAMMVFVLTGLAVGRTAMASPRMAKRMIGFGAGAAVTAWTTATILLLPLGALDRLIDVAPSKYEGEAARTAALWMPQGISDSWWGLTQRAAHTSSTFDVVQTLGSAVAILGVLMLVTREPRVAHWLRPVAAAGSMPLTIYSMHIVYLAYGPFQDDARLQYFSLAILSLTFGSLWQKYFGRGPLEWLTAQGANLSRTAMAKALDRKDLAVTRG